MDSLALFVGSVVAFPVLKMACSSMCGSEVTLIDGVKTAADIRRELKIEVDEMKKKGVTPGLAVVLVGGRRDSATYVRMKKKGCAEVGIESFGIDLPDTVTQDELIAQVDKLNQDPKVNGILVQLPLPKHIDEDMVLDRISQDKDVDGLHPLNVYNLAHTKTHVGPTGRKEFSFDTVDFHVSCTPQGCIELLDRYGTTIKGANAVVIGRSNIVGIPVALLLMQRHATVTIVHSRTKNPESVVGAADIVIAAMGRAEAVKASWIKPGAVVIDVGINSKDDPTAKRGYRLVGDVDFENAKKVASKITPVPGGVGPMTIAMLLRNTVRGTRRTAVAAGKL